MLVNFFWPCLWPPRLHPTFARPCPASSRPPPGRSLYRRKFTQGLMELCGNFPEQDSHAINDRQPLPDCVHTVYICAQTSDQEHIYIHVYRYISIYIQMSASADVCIYINLKMSHSYRYIYIYIYIVPCRLVLCMEAVCTGQPVLSPQSLAIGVARRCRASVDPSWCRRCLRGRLHRLLR